MAPKLRTYAGARARASAHEPARAGVWERGRMRRAGGRGAGQGRGEPGRGGATGGWEPEIPAPTAGSVHTSSFNHDALLRILLRRLL